MNRKETVLWAAILATSLPGAYLAGRQWGRSEKPPAVEQTTVFSASTDADVSPQIESEHKQEGNGSLKTMGLKQQKIARMSWGEIEEQLASIRGKPWLSDDLLLSRWLWRRLAELDPEKAGSMALSIPPTWERTTAIYSVLQTWSESDLRAAWKWLDDHVTDPVVRQNHTSSQYSRAVSSGQPDFAFEMLRVLPESRDKERAAGTLARSLAQYEPERMVDLLEELPEGGARNAAIKAFVDTWAAEDPRMAAEWALGLTDEQLVRTSLDSILRVWMSSGEADEVVAWIDSHPREARSDGWRMRVAGTVARIDLRRGATLALGIQDPATRQTALRGIVRDAVHISGEPEQARSVVEQLPQGPDQTAAISELVTAWSYRNPAGAADFLRATPLLTEEQRQELLARQQP